MKWMCSFPQNGWSVTLPCVLLIVSPIEPNSGNWIPNCFKKWIYPTLNLCVIWRDSLSVCLLRSQPFLWHIRHGQGHTLHRLRPPTHAICRRVPFGAEHVSAHSADAHSAVCLKADTLCGSWCCSCTLSLKQRYSSDPFLRSLPWTSNWHAITVIGVNPTF